MGNGISGLTDKNKATDVLYAALDPIANGWVVTTRKYQRIAYIIFLITIAATIFLSVFSPYKFFPPRPDLLHMRSNMIDKVIHNYKPPSKIPLLKPTVTKKDFQRKNFFGFPGSWRFKPENVK
jgi:hypothetical protein